MLSTVGTLCACAALSFAPASQPAGTKPATSAAGKSATAAAQPKKAAAIPNAAAHAKQPAQKPAAASAAKPQAGAQQHVAKKVVTPEIHPLENAIVQRTNQERVRRGLRPLAVDFGLLASARKHAAWMTRRQSLRHTNQPVAENIAMGQNSSDEVVRDWMNSPGHRANILNASYSRIGVAAYTSSSGTVYWCQQFLH